MRLGDGGLTLQGDASRGVVDLCLPPHRLNPSLAPRSPSVATSAGQRGGWRRKSRAKNGAIGSSVIISPHLAYLLAYYSGLVGELLLSPLRDNTQLSIPLLSPPSSPLSLRWVSPFGRWPFVYKMEGYDWVPLLPMLLEVILVAGAARVARKSPGVAAVLGLLLAVGAGYASNKLWAVSSALSPLNVSDIRLWPATPAARRVCGLRY